MPLASAAERLAQPLNHALGLGLGGVGHQQQKLLATPAGQNIGLAQHRACVAREGTQHVVARTMAVPVVDRLEQVKVNHRHTRIDRLAHRTALFIR